MPISPRSRRWPPTADRLPPGEMLSIHFALGKALEDIGDYPRAFEHLLQGNALKRREIDYDEAACQQDFRRIAERFRCQPVRSLAAAGDPSPAADLRPRHAPFRQHAHRADSGQPPPGPRRR